MTRKPIATVFCVWVITAALTTSSVSAQPAVRLPQSTGIPSTNMAYQPAAGGSVYSPPPTSAPLPSGAPATLGPPAFDAYSTNPGVTATAPTFGGPPAPYGSPLPPAGAAVPPGGVPGYPGMPPNTLGGAPASTVPYGQPYGTQPPSLYPNGLNTQNWSVPSMRFLTPRVKYTWIRDGEGTDDLGINDFDFSAMMAFPNFLNSNQPLHIAPSFSLHLWSGPRAADADLPANAYSAFVDFGWSSDPAQQLGGEIGVRLGAFTDFNTFNSDSWRIKGQGLFRLQTTPTMTLRGGVIYLARNKIKLLPAFGLLWTPNNQTRFDIFFPSPKFSQRMTTIGNQDVWWYIAAEYGGGAWTVERMDSSSDEIDINDIRLNLGVEWGQGSLLQQGRRTAFLEIGWVTNREVVYVVRPQDTTSLNDSFMLRTGFNY